MSSKPAGTLSADFLVSSTLSKSCAGRELYSANGSVDGQNCFALVPAHLITGSNQWQITPAFAEFTTLTFTVADFYY